MSSTLLQFAFIFSMTAAFGIAFGRRLRSHNKTQGLAKPLSLPPASLPLPTD